MKTTIGTSLGLALMLAAGVIAVMLAPGLFKPLQVQAAVTAPSATATPNEPGAITKIVVKFTTGAVLNIGDTIVLEFHDSYGVPSVISPSTITIAGRGATTTTTRFKANPSDVTVRLVGSPANDSEVTLTVPDMNPSDTLAEGIAAGNVTVTIRRSAGIKFPTETNPGRTIKVSTSQEPAQATATIFVPLVIKVSPTNGERGTVLTVTGLGFKDGTNATVWLDGDQDGDLDPGEVELGTSLIGSDDTFTATVTVSNPPFTPGFGSKAAGTRNSINAIDGRANTIDPDTANYGIDTDANCIARGGTLSCLSVFELRGKVTVTPSTAAIGDTVQVNLKDFLAGSFTAETLPVATSNLTIRLGGALVAHPAGTISSAGDATFDVVIPNGVNLGVQSLAVSGATFTATTRRFNMNILGPVLNLTPSTGLVPNQSMTVIGSGFTKGGSIDIGASPVVGSFSIGGTLMPASQSAKVNADDPISIDSGGGWSSTLVLPITSVTTTEGVHELKVTDSGGREGVTNLEMASRTLTLDPTESGVGTTVQLSGTGYPASNSADGAEGDTIISIIYNAAGSPKTVASLIPDASGNISGSFRVPLSAAIPSTNTVRASYTFGSPATPVDTITSHSVPPAELIVDPVSSPPGTTIAVSGTGFKPFTELSELKFDDIDVTPSPVLSTDAEGSFSAEFVVPALPFGSFTVTAKVGFTTASASFEIVAETPPAPLCRGLAATIVGTDAGETIEGTSGDDVIVGLGGDDLILGFDGNDTICGGPGHDIIFGHAGGDRISGDNGNDLLIGGRGNDRLSGRGGDDVLIGSNGKDRLFGGGGSDGLFGGKGNDTLVGGGGDDSLAGGRHDDTMGCGSGFDFANGGPGTDSATADCESTVNIP